MGLFDRFKKSVQDVGKKLDGRKDALEAVCASCALIASADGTIGDDEVATTISVIKNNALLSASFDIRAIETTSDVMMNRAKGGRSGRIGLYKEIEDIAKDPEIAEIVFVAALDVADNGGIGPEEKQVLNTIAGKLGLNAASYDL